MTDRDVVADLDRRLLVEGVQDGAILDIDIASDTDGVYIAPKDGIEPYTASITEDDVPAEIKERELSIARDKAREAGKPENIIEHIAEGALKKYYKENTLLEQAFVKDNKMNIQQYLQAQSKTLTVTAFKRASLSAE